MSDPTDYSNEMAGLLGHLEHLQKQVADAQSMLQSEEIEGSAGGGVVKVKVSGEMDFSGVYIDQSVFVQGDKNVLEDLILAALRDASAKLAKAREQVIGSAVGGVMGTLFAGMNDDGVELGNNGFDDLSGFGGAESGNGGE